LNLSNIIVEKSSLTEKEIESLISYMRIVTGEIHYKEAAAMRTGKPVTIGSYYRTIQQGRTKVRKAMVTLLLSITIGLVKTQDAERLIELVGKGSEIAREDEERFVTILLALLDRIVM